MSNRERWIPVYQPSLVGNEKQYVMECLESTWISSKGKFIGQFEEGFRRMVGASYATSVANGTVALHLALVALGIGPDDEVIVPTFTYIASVNAIAYVGAKPVFVDSERDSWQMDPADVRRKITPKTRAIMAVHLYGHPANMPALMEIAREHKLMVVEDCAEGFGSRVDGQHVGTFGDIGTFSFFGNKTITTGEGGMLVMNDATLHERSVHFKGQGLAKHRTYWHDVIGYNYRMTNLCAAIGVAQLERAEELIEMKLRLAERYHRALQHLPIERHLPISERYLHSYWMYSILVPQDRRDAIMAFLHEAGIETRPAFYPVHTMPMYAQRYQRFKNAEELGRRGINLPSWPHLSEAQVAYIADTLAQALERAR